MKKLRLLMLITAVLMSMVVSVHAQDGTSEDEQMKEMVITAFDTLNAATYYRFTATQQEQLEIASGQGLRRVTIAVETNRAFSNGRVQVDEDSNPVAVDVEVEQTSTIVVNDQQREALELTTNLHLIQVEGGLYVQVNEVSGSLHDESFDRLDEAEQQSITDQFELWVNIVEAPQDLEAILGYLDTGETTATFLSQIDPAALITTSNYTLEPEMILDIREVEAEGSTERAFELELDPLMMLDSMDLSALLESDTMLEELFAGMTLTQTVTLVTSGDSPRLASVRTEMVVDASFDTDGEDFDLTMESTTQITYSSIGSEFEVTVPENPVEEEEDTSDDTAA